MQRVRFGGTPSVQFDRRHLRHGDQAIGIVDRQERLAVGFARADRARHRVAVLLKELLATNALRAAQDGKWPMRQPRKRMFGNGIPIFREPLLGDPWP